MRRPTLALLAGTLLLLGSPAAAQRAPESMEAWRNAYDKDPNLLKRSLWAQVFEAHFLTFAGPDAVHPLFRKAAPPDQEMFYREYVSRGLASISTPLPGKAFREHSFASTWAGQVYLRNLTTQWQRSGVGQENWVELVEIIDDLQRHEKLPRFWQPRERIEKLAEVLRLYGRIDCRSASTALHTALLDSWDVLLREYETLHARHQLSGDARPEEFTRQRGACARNAAPP